jgi:hypothetical protein
MGDRPDFDKETRQGQAASFRESDMASKPWTKEEVSLLRQLHAAGASRARISAALNRPVQGVKHKARELGIFFESMRTVRKKRMQQERAVRLKAGIPTEM